LFDIYRRWMRDPHEYRGYYAIMSEVLQNPSYREHLRRLQDWYREVNLYAIAPHNSDPSSRELKALGGLGAAIVDGLGLMVQADEDFDATPCVDMWEAIVSDYVARMTKAAPNTPPRPDESKKRREPSGGSDTQSIRSAHGKRAERLWWSRPGLEIRDGRLTIAGHDAQSLAQRHGTPLYVCDVSHVANQVTDVHDALVHVGLSHRLRLALSVQREPQVLAALRMRSAPGSAGGLGLAATTPHEVDYALANGWLREEIVHTGTNLDDHDLESLLADDVRVVIDSSSLLSRLGQARPGASAGIRFRPSNGIGQAPQAFGTMSSAVLGPDVRPGFDWDELDQAVDIARRHRLRVDTVHVEMPTRLLAVDLPAFERFLRETADAARQLLKSA
jgi:hypothetical protein